MTTSPDWRNASDYPSPGTASNSRLAWEFLRRNPGYLESWATYLTALRFAAGKEPELSRFVDCIANDAPADKTWLASLEAADSFAISERIFDHPALTHTTHDSGGRKTHTRLQRHLAKPWGIDTLCNPSGNAFLQLPRFIGGGLSWSSPTSHGLRDLEDFHGGDLYDSQWLILEVDLRLPLNVLEERTSWAIRSSQAWGTKAGHFKPIKHRARPPALLIEYLRLLDARAAGVRLSDIGAALHPRAANHAPEYARNHRMKAAHGEAVRMRDEGYRVLPMLRDPNASKALRRAMGSGEALR